MLDLRFNIYLATDDGPHAPEGPGWYVLATYTDNNPEGHPTLYEVIPHVRLPAGEMEKLAQVIDNFVKSKPQNWSQNIHTSGADTTARNAVRIANEEAQAAIKAQIAYLQTAQQQLEILSNRVTEFDNPDAA